MHNGFTGQVKSDHVLGKQENTALPTPRVHSGRTACLYDFKAVLTVGILSSVVTHLSVPKFT